MHCRLFSFVTLASLSLAQRLIMNMQMKIVSWLVIKQFSLTNLWASSQGLKTPQSNLIRPQLITLIFRCWITFKLISLPWLVCFAWLTWLLFFSIDYFSYWHIICIKWIWIHLICTIMVIVALHDLKEMAIFLNKFIWSFLVVKLWSFDIGYKVFKVLALHNSIELLWWSIIKIIGSRNTKASSEDLFWQRNWKEEGRCTCYIP